VYSTQMKQSLHITINMNVALKNMSLIEKSCNDKSEKEYSSFKHSYFPDAFFVTSHTLLAMFTYCR
jgi:hypothetical protein